MKHETGKRTLGLTPYPSPSPVCLAQANLGKRFSPFHGNTPRNFADLPRKRLNPVITVPLQRPARVRTLRDREVNNLPPRLWDVPKAKGVFDKALNVACLC